MNFLDDRGEYDAVVLFAIYNPPSPSPAFRRAVGRRRGQASLAANHSRENWTDRLSRHAGEVPVRLPAGRLGGRRMARRDRSAMKGWPRPRRVRRVDLSTQGVTSKVECRVSRPRQARRLPGVSVRRCRRSALPQPRQASQSFGGPARGCGGMGHGGCFGSKTDSEADAQTHAGASAWRGQRCGRRRGHGSGGVGRLAGAAVVGDDRELVFVPVDQTGGEELLVSEVARTDQVNELPPSSDARTS